MKLSNFSFRPTPFTFRIQSMLPSSHATLRETLAPWARGLITGSGFLIGLFCTPSPITVRDEGKARQAMEAVDWLPNIAS